jgi:hypothetical protein
MVTQHPNPSFLQKGIIKKQGLQAGDSEEKSGGQAERAEERLIFGSKSCKLKKHE